MGHLHIDGLSLIESLSEHAGVKTGVALGREHINDFFRGEEQFSEYLDAADDDRFRIHSAVYESMIEGLLYKLGRLERRDNPLPGIVMFHRYKRDPKLSNICQSVQELHLEWMKRELGKKDRKSLDPTWFVESCFEKFGAIGGKLAIETIDAHIAYETAHLFFEIPPETEWKDMVELRDLFHSEKLDAQYGTFFDQRFIDYLNRNFEDIDRMNWRKFEHLTAEYLNGSGYKVELGPGRGDDGVDVRAWRPPEAGQLEGPAHLIVQCKRQRAAVEKVVVKALYADVVNEKAGSGMIVTTSRLSPGAQLTCKARNYLIAISDRETLRRWLVELRKPGAGV